MPPPVAATSARRRILLRHVPRREGDDLASVVEPVLGHERLDEVAVRLQQDPAADLQGDGHRLAQPRLGLLGPAVVEREDRQARTRFCTWK